MFLRVRSKSIPMGPAPIRSIWAPNADPINSTPWITQDRGSINAASSNDKSPIVNAACCGTMTCVAIPPDMVTPIACQSSQKC